MKQAILVSLILAAFGAGLTVGVALRTDSPASMTIVRKAPPAVERRVAVAPSEPSRPAATEERPPAAPSVAPSSPAPPSVSQSPDAATLLGVHLPETPSAKDLRDAARRLGAPLHPKADPRLTLRAELLERALRDFPADEKSMEDLIHLSQLLLGRGELERVTAALDAYTTKASLPPWEAEDLRANVASLRRDWTVARACYQRIADDAAAPEWKRVHGEFWVAYSVMQSGDPALARSLFQGIVDRHGSKDDPMLKGSVDGARNQIRLIDDAKK